MQLAYAGCEVTVLERRGAVGGRTSSIEADGFRFDCGPTFFLYPRVLSEIFRSVGYDLMEDSVADAIPVDVWQGRPA